VGVNAFTEGDDQPLETLRCRSVEERQVARLGRARRHRQAAVDAALADLQRAAATDEG
jgi:methylmalonyl-CoA mutase N-terminal domain/subunit